MLTELLAALRGVLDRVTDVHEMGELTQREGPVDRTGVQGHHSGPVRTLRSQDQPGPGDVISSELMGTQARGVDVPSLQQLGDPWVHPRAGVGGNTG